MLHPVKLPRQPRTGRPTIGLRGPSNLHGALTFLGIRVRRHAIAHLDRELLLYDAKASFRTLARRFHSDLGGNDADMRCVLEAFRLVKAYCTRKPRCVPADSRYEERVAKRDFLSTL